MSARRRAKRRNWKVVEIATYPHQIKRKVVESNLSKRGAHRAAGEWQDASDRNKLLVMSVVSPDKRGPLPTVRYLPVPMAESYPDSPSSVGSSGDTKREAK